MSDLHLGARQSQTTKILQFLEKNESEILILNGDIIDGWALKSKGKWTKDWSKIFRSLEEAFLGLSKSNNPFAEVRSQRIEVGRINEQSEIKRAEAITDSRQQFIDLTILDAQLALEEKGYELLGADFERIPTVTKKLTEEQMADVEKLLERLEDDDDVLKVYNNMVDASAVAE